MLFRKSINKKEKVAKICNKKKLNSKKKKLNSKLILKKKIIKSRTRKKKSKKKKKFINNLIGGSNNNSNNNKILPISLSEIIIHNSIYNNDNKTVSDFITKFKNNSNNSRKKISNNSECENNQYTMVSYSWGMKVTDILFSIIYIKSLMENYDMKGQHFSDCYYICSMVLNQKELDTQKKEFPNNVDITKNFINVSVPFSKTFSDAVLNSNEFGKNNEYKTISLCFKSYFTRVWCVFELYITYIILGKQSFLFEPDTVFLGPKTFTNELYKILGTEINDKKKETLDNLTELYEQKTQNKKQPSVISNFIDDNKDDVDNWIKSIKGTKCNDVWFILYFISKDTAYNPRIDEKSVFTSEIKKNSENLKDLNEYIDVIAEEFTDNYNFNFDENCNTKSYFNENQFKNEFDKSQIENDLKITMEILKEQITDKYLIQTNTNTNTNNNK